MTTPNAFDMSDATIERMLAERAGQVSPAGLVSGIMSAVNAVPQRRRAWLPQIRVKPIGWTGNRALIAAATVAIAALAVAAGVIVGALFRPPTPRVEPVPLPTQSATSAPSLEPTATWTPGPSDFAVVNGPLVVYQFNDTFVELFTLDPFNGRKVALGTLQKASSAMGQSIHWSADRKRAFVFENSDSVQFMVDVDLGTVQPLGLTSSGARDAVSPAGDLVARVEDEGGNGSSLSIVDLDDTEVLRAALPAGMQASSDIAWSPDGTSVLVSGCLPCERSPGAQHDHVYAVEVSDGTLRELADSTSGSFGWLRWSPDMATIAFSRCAEACPGGIGLLGLPDSTVTQLTTTADRTPGVVARWPPDRVRQGQRGRPRHLRHGCRRREPRSAHERRFRQRRSLAVLVARWRMDRFHQVGARRGPRGPLHRLQHGRRATPHRAERRRRLVGPR